jgi:ficolin
MFLHKIFLNCFIANNYFVKVNVFTEAKDCLELYEMGWREDGTYTIKPDGSTCIRTWCDMTNGGWTVIQRRINGRENFYRTWEEYVRGFGHVSGEYWLGLDNIFALTIYDSSLTIKMEAFGDISPTHAYANYQQFKIDDESSNFLLHVSGFSGDCGDSFSFQNGEMFTTKDRDNDQWDGNCAQTYEGAWWYKMCHYSNLNGRYLFGNHSSYANGVNWRTCWGYQYSIRTSVMQIRRT